MGFLENIKNSIYSPEFYKSIPAKFLGSAFKYFFLLGLLVTLITTASLIKPLIIDLSGQIESISKETINGYPQNLEVYIKDGQASINQQEPYFIALPEKDSSTDFHNLIVIDTETPFSITQFNEYKTATWLTKDSLFYRSEQNQVRGFELKNMDDLTVNKELLNSLYNQFSPYIKFIGPIILFLAFLGIYIVFSFRLIQLLFIALIVFLISKLIKKNLTYGISYKMSMFAITLGVLVELLISLTSRWTNFHGFPFMFTILALAVIFTNYFSKKE